MTKVYISPHASQVEDNNGVGQVIHAQHRYLAQYGIDLVSDPDQADVIAAHIQQGDLPRVDVLHVHGLYWTGDPGSGSYQSWHHEANSRILSAARRALAITVPSAWVGECFKRDMRIVPEVIGHGIDVLTPAYNEEPGAYILWNKNRVGDVCKPDAAQALAARGLPVVSTFGTPGKTMQVIGVLSHPQMLDCVRRAGVYLATTKETFGIGTLEALAHGVPVLGYKWGGTAELIQHQVTGYLVEPGDIDGLAAGYAWLMERRMDLIDPCRDAARQHSWDRVMQQYADLYHHVAEQRRAEQHRVSVVITNHNYGQYVPSAIHSAIDQTAIPHEVIVVDDGSTDRSISEIAAALDWAEHTYPQLSFHTLYQDNQGVAAARNNGIAAATGEYIVCLDADDVLAPDYIKVCRQALAEDRGLGVAYAGLGYLAEDGTIGPNVWRAQFNWEQQTQPTNPPATTIHCAAMFRRSMWGRAGGYQQVYAPGEDAEFWTRGLSVGFTAKQVTTAPLFGYRNHEGSASKTKQYRPIDTWHPWMRDQAYPMAAPATTQPLVRSYSEPLISVIIPVGPGHSRHLPAAIDSLLGQTFRNWEVIVVDDSGGMDGYLHGSLWKRYPFMTLVGNGQNTGTGAARNRGLSFARGKLCLFLDADDYLLPTALDAMLQVYAQGEAGYVYSDGYGRYADGHMEANEAPEYSQAAWFIKGQHAITVLMATEDADHLGGFDAQMRGWEDWDFFIRAAIYGICGQRVASPLLVYRYDTGQRREDSLAHKDELLLALRDRYATYALGETAMARCCGGNGGAVMAAKQALSGAPIVEEAITANAEGVVRMEFIGHEEGAVTWFGLQGRTYRAGREVTSRYINADPADVERLLSLDHKFRIVPGQVLQPPPVAIATPQPATPEPPTIEHVYDPPFLGWSPAAPEPPTMEAAPLALVEDDGLTPEQEAAMNKAVAVQARQQRRK